MYKEINEILLEVWHYAIQNAIVEDFILKFYHIKLCQQNDIHMWNMCI